MSMVTYCASLTNLSSTSRAFLLIGGLAAMCSISNADEGGILLYAKSEGAGVLSVDIGEVQDMKGASFAVVLPTEPRYGAEIAQLESDCGCIKAGLLDKSQRGENNARLRLEVIPQPSLINDRKISNFIVAATSQGTFRLNVRGVLIATFPGVKKIVELAPLEPGEIENWSRSFSVAARGKSIPDDVWFEVSGDVVLAQALLTGDAFTIKLTPAAGHEGGSGPVTAKCVIQSKGWKVKKELSVHVDRKSRAKLSSASINLGIAGNAAVINRDISISNSHLGMQYKVSFLPHDLVQCEILEDPPGTFKVKTKTTVQGEKGKLFRTHLTLITNDPIEPKILLPIFAVIENKCCN